MGKLTRGIILLFVFLVLWEAIVVINRFPPYILASPSAVFTVFTHQHPLAQPSMDNHLRNLGRSRAWHAIQLFCRLAYYLLSAARHWFLPLLLVSQALQLLQLHHCLLFGLAMVRLKNYYDYHYAFFLSRAVCMMA